jgi:hypothetical protein
MFDIKRFDNKLRYPTFKLLEQELGYFLNQIIEDNEISNSEKLKCLETICVLPICSVKEYEEKCNQAFFYRNKLKGQKCNNLHDLNPFIRLHDKDSLVSRISSLTGLKAPTVKNKLSEIIVANKIDQPSLLESFVNNSVISDAYVKEDNCLAYFGQKKWTSIEPPKLKDAHLCLFQSIQWSFPNSNSENLFFDQKSVENIKCRAGITDKKRKLVFLHKLNEEFNVRKPTVFDAGFHEQFKPNGLTNPLKECETSSGFEEYVHIPNKFINVVEIIFETFN